MWFIIQPNLLVRFPESMLPIGYCSSSDVHFLRRSSRVYSFCPSCSVITTVMAAAARFFIGGANSKLAITSSFGATLLKLSPSCNSRTKTQQRHAAHFTFQPDPVPTQYGEWLSSRWLTSPSRQNKLEDTPTEIWRHTATNTSKYRFLPDVLPQ